MVFTALRILNKICPETPCDCYFEQIILSNFTLNSQKKKKNRKYNITLHRAKNSVPSKQNCNLHCRLFRLYKEKFNKNIIIYLIAAMFFNK